jgi:DNA-binding response OmpR family regulator
MKSKILIIEDDHRMRRILQLLLESRGYAVNTADNGTGRHGALAAMVA